MKKIILVAITAITVLTSCKKSNNETPVNWAEELKGTLWAGEFKYNIGAYKGLQAFSIEMNGDGTVIWSDLNNGSRPVGKWTTAANKVTITFANATFVTADLSKENWSNFNNTSISSVYEIANLARSAIPSGLDNTTWKGKLSSGSDVTITFLPGYKLKYPGITPPISYTIAGAGIKFMYSIPPFQDLNGYAIILNNNMKGFVFELFMNDYSTWSAIKQ